MHPRPNQRPFLTQRRAQIFKLLRQQERALASPYLLRPEQQVPSSQPKPRTSKAPKQRTQRRTTPPQPALQENIQNSVLPRRKSPEKPTKSTVPTVPILLEEAKDSLLRYAQKPRSKFRFMGF
jgi:hypothetical protein